MKNSNGNSKFKTVLSGVAIFTASVLTLGLCAGLLCNLNFNDTVIDNTDNTETTGIGAVISEGESNGIQLLSGTLKAANSTATEYTLSATITPSYATNPELTWSIAWDTTWNGYNAVPDYPSEDVYGNEWYDGVTADIDISDYVSLSATTGSSITVTCYQAFGNPLIITCQTTDGSDLSATCQVDYQSYYTGIILTDLSSVTMSSSGTGKTSVTISPKYTIGTIVASGSVTYSVSTDAYNQLANYSSGSYTGKDGYVNEDDWIYEVDGATDKAITNDESVTILQFSTNWTTFVQELIDGNDYITDVNPTNSYSDYGEYALLDFLNCIQYVGLSEFHPFEINASLTDDKTGETYTASTTMTFASLDDYPTYAATGLNLNKSNITF